MDSKPIWSMLSILSCIAIPAGIYATYNSPTGDRLEEAIMLMLAFVAAGVLGLVFAIIGFVKKEQPRWVNWTALAIMGSLVLFGARFVI